MMEDGKFYQCPKNKTNSPVEAPSQESAKVALYCKACSLDKLGSCLGPLEVDKPEPPAPIVAPKRRGRPPKAKQEPVQKPGKRRGRSPKAKQTTDARKRVAKLTEEDQCRQALRALAVPLHPDYAGMIAPFHEEIQAARAAGRSWDIISKTLKKYGYNVGPKALTRLIEGENHDHYEGFPA